MLRRLSYLEGWSWHVGSRHVYLSSRTRRWMKFFFGIAMLHVLFSTLVLTPFSQLAVCENSTFALVKIPSLFAPSEKSGRCANSTRYSTQQRPQLTPENNEYEYCRATEIIFFFRSVRSIRRISDLQSPRLLCAASEVPAPLLRVAPATGVRQVNLRVKSLVWFARWNAVDL